MVRLHCTTKQQTAIPPNQLPVQTNLPTDQCCTPTTDHRKFVVKWFDIFHEIYFTKWFNSKIISQQKTIKIREQTNLPHPSMYCESYSSPPGVHLRCIPNFIPSTFEKISPMYNNFTLTLTIILTYFILLYPYPVSQKKRRSKERWQRTHRRAKTRNPWSFRSFRYRRIRYHWCQGIKSCHAGTWFRAKKRRN